MTNMASACSDHKLIPRAPVATSEPVWPGRKAYRLLLLQCGFVVHRGNKDCQGRGVHGVHLDFHTAPEFCDSELLLFRCCFASTETIRTVKDREPRTSISTLTQLLSSMILNSSSDVALRPQRPYEPLETIRDGEPSTSISTFTQLLRSVVQFSVALRPQRPYGLLGTGSPGRPPRLSHSC